MTVATPGCLAPFPAERLDRMKTPAHLAERGFSLRTLHDGDMPWLCELYASTRAEELALVPWPETTKHAFLAQQFALQHQHFVTHFPDADFLMIEHASQGPVGRYYLWRTPREHLLVDISLIPNARNHDLGSQLIKQSQKEAQSSDCPMTLHVSHANVRARRLYERLGFVEVPSEAPTHAKMRWLPTEPERGQLNTAS